VEYAHKKYFARSERKAKLKTGRRYSEDDLGTFLSGKSKWRAAICFINSAP